MDFVEMRKAYENAMMDITETMDGDKSVTTPITETIEDLKSQVSLLTSQLERVLRIFEDALSDAFRHIRDSRINN